MMETPEEHPRYTKHATDWVCVDCGDIIIHLFPEDYRKQYDLEGFWNNEVSVPDEEEDLRMMQKYERFMLAKDVSSLRNTKYDPAYAEDRDLFVPLGESSDGEEIK